MVHYLYLDTSLIRLVSRIMPPKSNTQLKQELKQAQKELKELKAKQVNDDAATAHMLQVEEGAEKLREEKKIADESLVEMQAKIDELETNNTPSASDQTDTTTGDGAGPKKRPHESFRYGDSPEGKAPRDSKEKFDSDLREQILACPTTATDYDSVCAEIVPVDSILRKLLQMYRSLY